VSSGVGVSSGENAGRQAGKETGTVGAVYGR
jgi:hypothetical protein